jgi:hypothetical protein
VVVDVDDRGRVVLGWLGGLGRVVERLIIAHTDDGPSSARSATVGGS